MIVAMNSEILTRFRRTCVVPLRFWSQIHKDGNSRMFSSPGDRGLVLMQPSANIITGGPARSSVISQTRATWVARTGSQIPLWWVWFQIQGGRWGPSSPYHGWALVMVLNTQHSLPTFVNHTPTNQHHKLDSVVFSLFLSLSPWLRNHQVNSQLTWLILKGYATREVIIREAVWPICASNSSL